jgi:hypothetical protein
VEVVGRLTIKMFSMNGFNPLSLRLINSTLMTVDHTEIPLKQVREVYHSNPARDIVLSQDKIKSILKTMTLVRRITCAIGILGIFLIVQ